MKYYLIHIEHKEGKEIVQYPSLKEARNFIKRKRFNRCMKHGYGYHNEPCTCKTYSIYTVSERLIDKKEIGKGISDV